MNIYAASEHQHPNDVKSGPEATEYTSNALKLFIESIDPQPKGQILDLGPACHENIMYLAQWIPKLYICDMFSRLVQCLHNKHPVHQIWRQLDYPPNSFDGILLWELADRLDGQEVGTLVKLCYTMLKPGGLITMIVSGEQRESSVVNSFVIGQNLRVHVRPQSHLQLPLCGRQNRDVLDMMSPLTPVRSFVYRHGLREFLFKRD
ncbi:MAG: class I SAM-dependent methyltransferase [Desulfobacterales bacterium]|nr:MAG: class I SAM-dependent methyltransferase [Desulfobacterales bacterium]UCD91185.1 MAG: class I SAM-dependent methyltransferase [Desulfobacterales bacterium]